MKANFILLYVNLFIATKKLNESNGINSFATIVHVLYMYLIIWTVQTPGAKSNFLFIIIAYLLMYDKIKYFSLSTKMIIVKEHDENNVIVFLSVGNIHVQMSKMKKKVIFIEVKFFF